MCKQISSSKTRIIVVDDEDTFIQALKTKLEWEGFSVEAFGSREQAKKVFEEKLFDIALIDLNMEDDDEIAGLSLAEKFLEINRFVKIIMVTNYSQVPVAVYAMKIGVYGFVSKEPADLLWDEIFTEIKQAMMKLDLEIQEADVRNDIASLIPDLEGNIGKFKILEKRWSDYHNSVLQFKQSYSSEERKNKLRKLVSSMKEKNRLLKRNRNLESNEQ